MQIQQVGGWQTQSRPGFGALFGAGMSQGLSKAGELYLQNKMQNYFNTQQNKESAAGYEKMSKIPGLEGLKGIGELLQDVPASQHQGIVGQLMSNIAERGSYETGGRADLGSMLRGSNIPTPEAIAISQNAAMRMPQNTQYNVPSPTQQIPQQAVNIPQQKAEQQIPSTQEGTIAPRVTQATQPGMPTWQGKRVGEMDDQEFDQFKSILPTKKSREAAEKDRRAQQSLGATVSRAETAKKALEHKIEMDLEKSKELSKEDKEFVKKVNESAVSTKKLNDVLDKMQAIRSQHDVGMGAAVTGAGRQAQAEYNVLAKDILPLIKDMFPRGFTDKEFKRIEDTWIPTSGDTNATLNGKEAGWRGLAQEANQIYSTMNKYQKEDGSYPKNIQSKVSKDIYQSDEFKIFKKDILNGPKNLVSSGISDTPFKADQVVPGTRMKSPGGKIFVSDGKKWIEE